MDEQSQTTKRLQRRGLMAGGAALVAAALAKLARPEAAEASFDGTVAGGSTTQFGGYATPDGVARPPTVPGQLVGVLGTNGPGTMSANAVPNAGVAGFSAARPGVAGRSQSAAGVLGQSDSFAGVSGFSTTAVGTFGFSDSSYGVQGASTNSTGVVGQANASSGVQGTNNSGAHAAVQGTNAGSGPGVRGDSTSGIGVVGAANNSYGLYGTSASNFAVYGASNSSVGVFGSSISGASIGVYGQSDNAFAVYGVSLNSIGVGAVSQNSTAINASSASNTNPALQVVQNGSGPAANFFGRVVVNGPFTVVGAKNAAVPHPDGHHRLLYCEESTESWFSDYGRANLVNGRVTVQLDRDFAAVVRADDYEVFLTPRGDCKGLYVAAQNPNGFEVRELQGGTSSLAFSYRVVAKRKDIPGQRLEKVDLPARVQVPTVPRPPAPPQLEPVEPPRRPPEPPGRGPQR
jgi:hypothetical protein